MRLTRTLLLVSLLALVVVPAALALRFTDDSFTMPTGVTGQAYSKQFNGAAGCGPALPYQYRLLNGSVPPGLSLSSSGLISGTPTTVGSWSFWVELSDQNPPTASWCRPSSAQREFTITVVPQAPPGEVARPFRMTLAPTGGESASTWSLADGASLPAGLTLAATGVISGEPTAAGSFAVKLVVTDTHGSKNTVDVTLAVAGKLSIVTKALPRAKAHHGYSTRLAVEGGVEPVALKLVRGSLPAGIRLDSNTGELAGKARRAGSFRFTLQVSDKLGAVSTRRFVLKVGR